MRLAALVVPAAVSVVLAACSGGSSADPPPSSQVDGGASSVTYYKDVLPILQTSCQGCHTDGGIAPFALTTYAQAKAQSEGIVAMTASRQMPPWGALDTAECKHPRPFKGDARLSEAQIATLRAWREGGTAEGDPKDAPPPPPARATGLPNVEMELTPQSELSLGGTTDQFRCFVLDPKLTETRWVNGTFFVPGNATIVHHALLFTDPNRESLQKVGADGSYECFGGGRLTNGGLLAAWAPGGVPSELPANVGAPLAAGTLLVMQIHYHPHAGASPAPDKTKVQLRFTKEAPEWLAVTRLIGNFRGSINAAGDGLLSGPADPTATPVFSIPAGASGHTESMLVTLPPTTPDLRLYGVGAHMHYVGTDEKITIERASPQDGEPANECLLQEPRWDFDWQRGYAYDAPIDKLPTVRKGDKLRIRCTYDNTMQNPKVAAALAEQRLSAPKEVTLGESTLDEMCLGAFVLLTKRP